MAVMMDGLSPLQNKRHPQILAHQHWLSSQDSDPLALMALRIIVRLDRASQRIKLRLTLMAEGYAAGRFVE